MKKKKIGFAVAGCGYIGIEHAKIAQNSSGGELIALCDSSSEAETAMATFGVPYFNTLSCMLNEGPEFDVLCVATPNGLHEEHAILGLRAGKHIVLEKPMALAKSGCERIMDESVRQNKHVFCVTQNRYSPLSLWLKNIISSNVLGKIFIVQINCYWNRDERYYTKDSWHGTKELDGGSLFTQFSHFIDTMFWYFGDIRNVKANIKSYNHKHLTDFEDSGNVIFDFIRGGSGVLNFSTSVWNRNLESSITIIAEKGTVKVAGQYMEELVYCDIKGYDIQGVPSEEVFSGNNVDKKRKANNLFLFKDIIEGLNGTKVVASNVKDGLKVVEIIERIYNAGISNENSKNQQARTNKTL